MIVQFTKKVKDYHIENFPDHYILKFIDSNSECILASTNAKEYKAKKCFDNHTVKQFYQLSDSNCIFVILNEPCENAIRAMNAA